MRCYLGVSDRQARFDRYDYEQKFEYWGMVLGSIAVVGTGLILLFPIQVTQWLPGAVIRSPWSPTAAKACWHS